jgi:hypothetical protein
MSNDPYDIDFSKDSFEYSESFANRPVIEGAEYGHVFNSSLTDREGEDIEIVDIEAVPDTHTPHYRRPTHDIKLTNSIRMKLNSMDDEELSEFRDRAREMRDFETLNPERKRHLIKIAEEYVSLFPTKGQKYVNAVKFTQQANAKFIQELNEFNTTF